MQQAIKYPEAIKLLRAQARSKFLWGMLAGAGLASTAFAIGVWLSVIIYV